MTTRYAVTSHEGLIELGYTVTHQDETTVTYANDDGEWVTVDRETWRAVDGHGLGDTW